MEGCLTSLIRESDGSHFKNLFLALACHMLSHHFLMSNIYMTKKKRFTKHDSLTGTGYITIHDSLTGMGYITKHDSLSGTGYITKYNSLSNTQILDCSSIFLLLTRRRKCGMGRSATNNP